MRRILLTNDDGIEAPGLRALHASVQLAADRSGCEVEVVVVAPDRGRSECSHSVETRESLRISTVRDQWTALNGTPVDCVRVAVLAMGFEPDVVLSGVNAGANLGINLMVSGTFAAAREASLLGIPAMAISQYRKGPIPQAWDHVPSWVANLMIRFWDETQGPSAQRPGPLWNVNLPAMHEDPKRPPEVVECKVDRCPIERIGRVDSEGAVTFEWDFHGRPREVGSDVAECFGGKTTLSRLSPYFAD